MSDTRYCQWCGARFPVKGAGRKVYCSRACREKHKSYLSQRPQWPTKRVLGIWENKKNTTFTHQVKFVQAPGYEELWEGHAHEPAYNPMDAPDGMPEVGW